MLTGNPGNYTIHHSMLILSINVRLKPFSTAATKQLNKSPRPLVVLVDEIQEFAYPPFLRVSTALGGSQVSQSAAAVEWREGEPGGGVSRSPSTGYTLQYSAVRAAGGSGTWSRGTPLSAATSSP